MIGPHFPREGKEEKKPFVFPLRASSVFPHYTNTSTVNKYFTDRGGGGGRLTLLAQAEKQAGRIKDSFGEGHVSSEVCVCSSSLVFPGISKKLIQKSDLVNLFLFASFHFLYFFLSIPQYFRKQFPPIFRTIFLQMVALPLPLSP